MEDIYLIKAYSKEGHGYEVELCSKSENITENFEKHINNIGWVSYGYKIKEYKQIEAKNIKSFV